MRRKRSKQREEIMIVLYQISIFKEKKTEYDLDELIEDYENKEYIKEIVSKILENEPLLVKLANKKLNEWNINRLGKTDAAIIKLGIYEILYTDTPAVVCIDEAIELAKKYSDPKIKGMINGVLDKIYHDKEKNE